MFFVLSKIELLELKERNRLDFFKPFQFADLYPNPVLFLLHRPTWSAEEKIIGHLRLIGSTKFVFCCAIT